VIGISHFEFHAKETRYRRLKFGTEEAFTPEFMVVLLEMFFQVFLVHWFFAK
jgi:hypothetical protein